MTADLRDACSQAMHVVTASGKVHRGGRGGLFILQHTGWGVAARLLMLPPLVWGADLAYWIVSNNRRFFGRFMFRRE